MLSMLHSPTLEALSYASASYINNITNFEKVFNVERLAWLVTRHVWNLQMKVHIAFVAMAATHVVAMISASRLCSQEASRCVQQC